jgi:hypothetical protein
MAISRVCSIPNCDKPAINSRGWCSLHYQRWQKHGDPLRSKKERGICSIPDCGKPHYGNSYCAAHNKRVRLYGDPYALKIAPHGEPIRFFKEVVLAYGGDECLIWPYGRSSGYGVVDINHKKKYVHRLACEAENGPAPTPDHEAAHTCGKGGVGCVARRHLSWKTGLENSADKFIHGTVTRGSRHGNVKLTEDAAREIRELQGAVPWADLAKRFGVSVRTVRDVQCRRRWGWLE